MIVLKDKLNRMISELTDQQIRYQLFMSQAFILILACILGFFIFNHWSEFFDLFIVNDRRIITIGFSAGLVIVLIDLLFIKFLPNQYFDDGGINERIFRNQSIGAIFSIAFVVAITEEILFRGVIQTQFGLITSSIIFACIHYRYLFNPFLFINVVVVSFVFGIIFHYTNNLLVTIMMHFTVDFLLGIIYRNIFFDTGGFPNGRI